MMSNLKSEEKILREKRNEIALKNFNEQREKKERKDQRKIEYGNIIQDEEIEFIDDLLAHGYKPIPPTAVLINSFSVLAKMVCY
jgi:hypothetical protein